jgi:hypothetical protein
MNVDDLISQTKAKFSHNLAKFYLQEKYKSRLTFADQNGLWEANQTFISFLSSQTSIEIVLLDLYENPIKVDRIKLLEKTNGIYNEVMNDWYKEFTELQNKR